jgi:hypothetical protein
MPKLTLEIGDHSLHATVQLPRLDQGHFLNHPTKIQKRETKEIKKAEI